MRPRDQWTEHLNYENDARVRAARKGSPWGAYDENRGVIAVEVYDDDEDGLEEVVDFPAELVVCDLCRGRGKHVNPAIDCGGISAEDFAEDPDFAESYFAGHYDQPCNACGGKRVVPIIDRKRILKDSKLENALLSYDDQEAERAHWDAIERSERRNGA